MRGIYKELLGVTVALMGKHIDKLDADAAKGIRTQPVQLGERLSRFVAVSLIASQYVLAAYLVIIGLLLLEMFFTPVRLVAFLSLPMFFQVVLPMYRHPRPAERPADYPVEACPLWSRLPPFASSRWFGILFLDGLTLDAILQLLILPLL